MNFEWDEQKNNANQEKHDISFEEAQYAFFDKNRLILEDEKHSTEENRYFCIGEIERGIVTIRLTMRDNIRIIGAGFWREGRRLYHERNSL
jgi:uncharacterized protein